MPADISFTILKCDSAGLLCNYYSAPYRIREVVDLFDESGQLFIEDNVLYLQVGDEHYLATDDYFTRRDK